MERKIIITNDGSSSIYLPEWEETYHSKHGAIQEAYHVFIKNGLNLFRNDSKLSILEIGFGTGLNCFISFLEAKNRKLDINYTGVEGYPLEKRVVEKLNYIDQLDCSNEELIFKTMHEMSWNEKVSLSKFFSLTKRRQFFNEIDDKNKFNLIYFDAFGARVQPELWTEFIFKKMFVSLKIGGALVTYAAKGSVRRAMDSVGFSVEKLPGPPGKREMLRGVKLEYSKK